MSKFTKGSTNLYKGVAAVQQKDDTLEKLFNQVQFQKEIIDWNENYVGKKRKNGNDIMEDMKKIQLVNGSIVVQLYRQDYIPESNVVVDANGKIKSWRFAPPVIDIRQTPTHPESLAVNPIPTIYKGVIVAMAQDVKLSYLRKKKELESLGEDVSGFLVPEVGDAVYLKYFMTKNTRFYINKQEKELDIVITPQNYTIENFDYTCLIGEFEIESIIKKEFLGSETDAKYKFRDAMMSINELSDLSKVIEINENWQV